MCKTEKELTTSNFSYKCKAKGIYAISCKDCHRIYSRAHYKSNKDYYVAKSKSNSAAHYAASRSLILDYFKAHPCVDCGESDPIVLDFDHLKDKIRCVSQMVRAYSLEKIRAEIAKCEVRCSNCHRRKTATQLGWYRSRW